MGTKCVQKPCFLSVVRRYCSYAFALKQKGSKYFNVSSKKSLLRETRGVADGIRLRDFSDIIFHVAKKLRSEINTQSQNQTKDGKKQNK
jgi:hypothetical protein